MQVRTAVIVGCILSCVLLTALFALAAVMPNAANRWVDEGMALAPYQMVLLQIAAFWSRYWWLGSPVVILLAFTFVGAIFSIQRVRSP